MAASAGMNGNAIVSIDQVEVTYLYTPPSHRFDQLCLSCTSVILALAEECCNECLVNGFTAECLECEGFLAFARLLIQELNHRPMAFDQEVSSDQEVARTK